MGGIQERGGEDMPLKQSQWLLDVSRKEAADLYRKNWDGCRELWKLDYHARKVNFTVLK
jgi:hypothetical protein